MPRSIFPIFVALVLACCPAPASAQVPMSGAPRAAPAASASPTDQTAGGAGIGGSKAAAAPESAGAVQPLFPTGVSPDPKAGSPASADEAASSLIPHDLSPVGMFLHADLVVKAVMIGLAFASLVTWTILIAKAIELFGARGRANRALSELAEASTLRDAAGVLKNPKAPVTRLADAALAETERSRGLPHEGIKDRAAALLARIEARAGRRMGRGTGFLATIGSTAPFVGLFGTVWGIMDAFIGISQTHTTNLAVVAPGIAEALLATAFGLVAAIPAVIIYNVFARGITGYRSLLGDASTEVMRLLSRDLDRDGASGRTMPVGQAAE